jgi:threonine dehydrogenase-like Zn-dependent dehydrogenase
MRALVVPANGRLELADIPKPRPGPYQALVKIECCGICGSTDWKLINGRMTWAPPAPLVLGHESVGRVVEVGAKVAKFKAGDRVTRVVYPGGDGLNSAMGGFAEFGLVTDAAAMARDGDASLLNDYNALRQNVVPAGLGPVEAALAISLAETASVFAGLPSLRHKTILVAGTGVAGLAFTLWAKLAGARVVALGRREERLAAARKAGADLAIDTRDADWPRRVLESAGGPVDGIIEAIGDVAFASKLLDVLKPGGFASAYGAPADGAAYPKSYDSAAVDEHLSYAWVADMLAGGRVDPRLFVSHTWPFADVVAAFAQVKAGEVTKGFVLI